MVRDLRRCDRLREPRGSYRRGRSGRLWPWLATAARRPISPSPRSLAARDAVLSPDRRRVENHASTSIRAVSHGRQLQGGGRSQAVTTVSLSGSAAVVRLL